MNKPFKLPSISELAMAQHNDMLMYQKQLEELEAIANRSIYDVFKLQELRRKIKDCAFMLERYKPDIREEKLKKLGL
jgi:hypothetical protein